MCKLQSSGFINLEDKANYKCKQILGVYSVAPKEKGRLAKKNKNKNKQLIFIWHLEFMSGLQLFIDSKI